MSIVRLAGTSAGSGGINAGTGYPTLSTGGDMIGVIPLNVASSGLGTSSLNAGYAAGATALTPFGYGNALGQYGADQLSFAFSQGDYLASGATPQTFLQNQLNLASSFSQFPAISQTMFNTISLQNSGFATSAQPMDLFSAGYPSAGSYAGTGFATSSGAFGVLNAFSPSPLPVATTAILDPGLANTGLTGTLGTIPTETAAGSGVPSLGLGLDGAVNAAGATTGQALGSVLGGVGANALGIAQSATGLGTGADAASSLHNGETAASGAAVPGEASPGSHGQAAQAQAVAPLVTAGNALLTQEPFSIKALSADPFAHYSDLIQGHQTAPGATGLDLYANSAQDAVKLAAAIGSDHMVFSDHVVSLLVSHAGQAGDAHADPVGHALQHTADVGGHLL